MTSENLYPQVIPPGVVVKTEAETKAYIDAQLNETKVENNKNRIEMMMKDYKKLEDEYKHFVKIKGNWMMFNNVLIYSGAVVVIGGLSVGAITGSLASAGIAVPALVGAIVSGVSAIQGILHAGLVLKLIKPKIEASKFRCDLADTYMKRVYLYIEKAKDDGVITIDELERFNLIMKEFELMKSKRGVTVGTTDVESPIDFDVSEMQRQIDIEAKKQVMLEMKDVNLKKSVEKYRSKLGLNAPDPPIPTISTVVSSMSPAQIV